MSSLQFLQLCRRANRIELGDSPVRTAAFRGSASLLLFASDAAENSKKRIKTLSQNFDIPLLELNLSKSEFGALFSRTVLSSAAITDDGMARTFLEKWDSSSPLLLRFTKRSKRVSPFREED